MAGGIAADLLYFGDNLGWLRDTARFPDESVDLVYLDPPFNSNRSYNVLFKQEDAKDSEAQIHAFEDTWSWDHNVQELYNQFWKFGPEKPGKMLKAMVDALGHNDVTAYLAMMAPRLVELHRVLKPTGSLYLHCDPTASHYLKMMLDSIFGPRNYLNEIVWKRTTSHNDPKRYGRIADRILFYARGGGGKTFNPVEQGRAEYSPEQLARYKYKDDGGPFRAENLTAPHFSATRTIDWRGVHPGRDRQWRFSIEELERLYVAGRILLQRDGRPRKDGHKVYLSEAAGPPLQDVWTDILLSPTSSERLGYPTQKPLALLERIIAASSNPGDVVLDPFCGCGTAVHAAHRLGRHWIGIDITPVATDLIRRRMEEAFPGLKVRIEGWPVDMAGARALAEMEDKYLFQDWAVMQAGGRPAGGVRKKGADRGVDGVITFIDAFGGKDLPRRGVISVKAGKTGPQHVRDLAGVVASDTDTVFGVLICLEPPTKPMREAALAAGTWESGLHGTTYPVIQILSAQDLIEGVPVKMPAAHVKPMFATAPSEKKKTAATRPLL